MSAPSKIEMGKKYRTRDGGEVNLFTVTSQNRDYPIAGEVLTAHGWVHQTWNPDGKYMSATDNDRDLIEVREPREFKVWEKDGVIAVPTDMHHEKNLENAGCKLITLREVLPEGEQ